MLIRTDGLVVRKSTILLFTIPLNGTLLQWWGDGKDLEFLPTDQTTAIKDQYLLMPKSILDSWTKDEM